MWRRASLAVAGLALFVTTLLSAGCRADALPSPPPADRTIRSELDVVGCYEITTLDWDTPARTLQHLVYEPPPTFFLSAELHPLGRRRITSSGDESIYSYSAWRVVNRNTLDATWRGNAGSVHVEVQRAGNDPTMWVGHATRIGATTSSGGRMAMRRVSGGPCPQNRR